MKTKLEAALVLLNMAQTETDEGRRDALLVGIHHTLRRKLQQDRNRASRAARSPGGAGGPPAGEGDLPVEITWTVPVSALREVLESKRPEA